VSVRIWDERVPGIRTIHNLVNELRKTGLLIDKKEKHKRRVLAGNWPACSPVLNPCSFFFWGYLKANIYNSNPGTQKPKKYMLGNCKYFCRAASKGKSDQTVFCRCEECLRVERQHFQHCLWSVNLINSYQIFWEAVGLERGPLSLWVHLRSYLKEK
jgi:hypothetical protein